MSRGPILMTTTVRDAARARREAVRAPADRPQRRRCAAPDTAPQRVGATLASVQLREDPAAEGQPGLTFEGVASVTGQAYEMYDAWGPYMETVRPGAFRESLARPDLDVPLVIGHDQLRRIARTGNTVSPLVLTEVETPKAINQHSAGATGLHVLAPSLPADDVDVQAIAPKLRAGLISEMSFAFRIDAGSWSDDYTEFTIAMADIHRGDVAIVGYGANPYTTGGLRAPATSEERRRRARLAAVRAAAAI